jgi:hypothetical protein
MAKTQQHIAQRGQQLEASATVDAAARSTLQAVKA